MRLAIGVGTLAQDARHLKRRTGARRRVDGMGHRSGPGATRELQQDQWGRGGRGLVLGQVQIAHGRADGVVSEPTLNDGELDSGLEQASRVAMAKGMDSGRSSPRCILECIQDITL